MIRNLGQVAAIYIGSSQPTNTNLIWLDNTVVPYAFRAYDGSTWSELATRDWVKMFVDGWLVSLPPSTQAGDTDYLLINSNNVNYKITVKEFVKSAVGNPLDFKGVIRTDADFPNPANCEAGDMYVIITSPAGGTVTDPYSGQVFEDTEKIVWDEVTKSWASLGKIEINVDLSTDYSATNVTINSSAGKGTTINAASTSLAGVMLPQQVKFLAYLSNGSTVPGEPSELDPDTPAHKHNYGDILNRLISQQEMGDSTYHPMSQKVTTDNLNLKFDKANVVQVQGAATDMVMSQKAVTDALKTLSDDFNNKLTNYLPLAGGTMKGNIRFPIGNGIVCNDVTGTAAYVVLRTWNANNSTRMYVGTVNFPTYISSTASDLIHDRNGSSYLLWDSYNLPTPASTTDLANYLPLAGGTMTGVILMNNNVVIQSKNSSGTAKRLIGKGSDNVTYIGDSDGHTFLYSDAADIIHVRNGTNYTIYDSYNFNPGNYLPLTGGTLTGQLTIKQGVDIKLRLQSTDADNYCIIQAINAQASQLGVFGYAGDKWAIGHNGIYYEIWDKYNLTNPVTYTTNTYNHATLTNKDGQYFTYIKAGTNGLLPHSKATLVSGGSGFLGTSDQSFNAGYINNLHTNKVTFGVNGPYIIGGTSATQFLDANGGVQKVATGGLYVGVSYASDALNLVPTGGIYSRGAIKSYTGFTSDFRISNLTIARTGNDVLHISSFANDPENMPGTDPISSQVINDGVALTYFWQGDYAFQLVGDIDGTGMAYRMYHPSTGTSTSWKFLADTNWVSNKITSVAGNYLPLTGGTLTGNLTINTAGSTTFVINNNDINGSETFMRVLRKGTASAAIGFRDSLGAYIYNYNSKKYLFIDNDGYARVGTTSGSTRLALITDIPTVSGYLPLTGGILSGQLIINSISNSLILNNTNSSETESFIKVQLNGTSKAAIGFLSSIGSYIYNYESNKYLFVGTDGAYLGNTISKAKLLTSADLSGYATQTWANSKFAPLSTFKILSGYPAIVNVGNEFILTSNQSGMYVNHRTPSDTIIPTTWYWKNGTSTGYANGYWGNLYMVEKLVATQEWVSGRGYLTSITKSMVTSALGYTPPTTNTTYSQATSSTLGLVKIGATGLAAKNYAVQLNSSGQMYVAVPWTDTDTNTHYTTKLYTGASGTAANSAISNPYLKVTDDNTYRNQVRFIGAGATSISSDASGNITITSTNTTYGLASSSSNGLMSSSQYSKLSNCIETVSAANMVTSVQVVDTIPGESSQVTGRLYLKFA